MIFLPYILLFHTFLLKNNEQSLFKKPLQERNVYFCHVMKGVLSLLMGSLRVIPCGLAPKFVNL